MIALIGRLAWSVLAVVAMLGVLLGSVLLALAAVALAAVLAGIAYGIATRGSRRDVEELADLTRHEPADEILCLWCYPTPAGKAGRCTCTSTCPDVEWCIGDYTRLGTAEFTAELNAMLGEGESS